MKNNRASGFPVIFVGDFSEEKATNKVAAGGALPTGMVSQGQKLQRKKSLLVLAVTSSCSSTPLVGKENYMGWGETDDHRASEVTSRRGI